MEWSVGKGGVREHDTPTRHRADLHRERRRTRRPLRILWEAWWAALRCEALVDVHMMDSLTMGMRVDSAPQANGRLVGHAVEPRFLARHPSFLRHLIYPAQQGVTPSATRRVK